MRINRLMNERYFDVMVLGDTMDSQSDKNHRNAHFNQMFLLIEDALALEAFSYVH